MSKAGAEYKILAVGSEEMRICGEIVDEHRGETYPLTVKLTSRADFAVKHGEDLEPVLIEGDDADLVRRALFQRLRDMDASDQVESGEKRLLNRMRVIPPEVLSEVA